ncbi:MAG: hemolysin family protein [Hyphomicrobiales bacterium]|nr:hemolysin family protein [Hyphomicrobiales bacterium]
MSEKFNMSSGSHDSSGSKPDVAKPGIVARFLDAIGLRSAPSIREDIEDALAESDVAAELSPRERDMLKNVLGLRAKRVQDVMVPRADIVAVPIDISLGDLLRVFRTASHSRLPVYDDTLDDPRGMIHLRDFVDFISERAEQDAGARRRKLSGEKLDLARLDLSMPLSAAKILRPVLFAPPSMQALDLLAKMQSTRTHMALVIDEYGGTDGLVSIEDLVEIVVGEIEDEHDLEETATIVTGSDGSIIVDGRADLADVSKALGVDFTRDDEVEEIETIAGYVGFLAGRVPIRGEIITGFENFEFEVLDADPRRVKRLRIMRRVLEEDKPKPSRRRKIAEDESQKDRSSNDSPDT